MPRDFRVWFFRSAEAAARDAGTPSGLVRFLPMLLLATALAGGCSTGNAATETVSGWFGAGSGAQAETAYARSAGVVVYAEPSSGAKQVGRLGASEKVVRKNEKNGFARVSARGGKLVGWVAASKLTSKRPAAKSASTGNSPGTRDGAATGAEDVSAEAGQDGNGADAAPADVTVTAGDAIEAADAAVEAAAQSDPQADPRADSEPPRPAAPEGAGTRNVGASIFDPY